MKKFLFIILWIVIFLYISTCVLVYVYQKDLMFFPSREIRSFPRDTNVKEVSIQQKSDDIKLNAWFIDNKSDKTVIFFHGNGGNIYSNQERITAFNTLGVNALMFDYRGYGKSHGSIRKEEDIYRDGEAAYQYVLSQWTKPENIIIWGQSLGGAVAIHTAQWRKISQTIIESTFSSMDSMARDQYWFLPTQLLWQFHFRTIDKITNILSPILVIHSPDDEMIGFHNWKDLYEKANTPKEFLETRGSHNGGFSQSYPLYMEKLEKFLKK